MPELKKFDKSRILIAVPTHENLPYRFAYDLARLMSHSMECLPQGSKLGIAMVAGTYVHAARQELADAAVRQGAGYVLWLDSDMSFPPDALGRLLMHDKPVVGINYSKRAIGEGFTAVLNSGDRVRLATRPGDTGLAEVEALGMGCVLIRADALQNMPDPKKTPWFQNVHLGDGNWMGEDVWFFKLIRDTTGFKIYVDQDLSQECAHIGQFSFEPVHALMGEDPAPQVEVVTPQLELVGA